MEPNLMRKYLAYQRKKDKGGINPSSKVNDSGVSLQDMQSNDYWSIAFLLLLTHDPRFGVCYTYGKDNPDQVPIMFHKDKFMKLFRKVQRKYETDRNFCYVISRMCGYYRFQEDSDVRGDGDEQIYQPMIYSQRDLKFFVWILTYGKFPEEKIIRYEDGHDLKEVDEYATLASNDSLYNSVEEEEQTPLESEVKQFKTGKQILETLDQNKRKLIEQELHGGSPEPLPEYHRFEPSLYNEPTYSFFEQKSYIEKQIISKKEIPRKTPTQKFQEMPRFLYQKPEKDVKQVNYDIMYNFNNVSDLPRSSKMMIGYSVKSMDKQTPTKMMLPVQQSKLNDHLSKTPTAMPLLDLHWEPPFHKMPTLPRPPRIKPTRAKKAPEPEPEPEYDEIVIQKKVESPPRRKQPKAPQRYLEDPSYDEPEKLTKLENKIMKSLRQISKRKIHTTTVDDVGFENDTLLTRNKHNHLPDEPNNCRCRLCSKAKQRGPRVVNKRPALPSFDTKMSIEENQKVRLESRIKRVSRVKYKNPKYEDPYRAKRFSPAKMKKYSTGKNEYGGKVDRFETSHYKTNKYMNLQNDLALKTKSPQGSRLFEVIFRNFEEEIKREFAKIL